MLCVPLIAIAAGVTWYGMEARFVSTDNAYVKTDVTSISPNIDGRVTSIYVEDNQLVRKGQVLFSLDDRTHHIAVARANAKLASVLLHIQSLHSRYRRAMAELDHAQKQIEFRQKQFERQQDLFERNVGSVVTLETTTHRLDIAKQNLLISQEKAQQILTELGGDINQPIEQHPLYLEEIAARNNALLSQQDTKIVAPADGLVTRLSLQIGEWVQEGRPVFSLVSNQKWWIEANLKETRLTHVNLGQSVEIHIDAYPSVKWHGTVQHISAAMGSEFMVLPPQNATGNWIKVVQRVPVHISIDDLPKHGLRKHDLKPRAGMTTTIAIDTEVETKMATWIRQHLGLFVHHTPE